MNKPEIYIESNSHLECYELYSKEPLCDHDRDNSPQHIASVYDLDDAIQIRNMWNSNVDRHKPKLTDKF